LGGFAGGALGGIAIHSIGSVNHALVVAVVAALVVCLAFPRIIEDDQKPKLGERHRFTFPRQSTIFLIGAMALMSMSAEGSVLTWSALYLQRELLAEAVQHNAGRGRH